MQFRVAEDVPHMAFSERETRRNKKQTINATKHQVSCWSKITIGWSSLPRESTLDRSLLDRSTGKRLVSLAIPRKGWQWTGRWLYLDVPAVKDGQSPWHLNGRRLSKTQLLLSGRHPESCLVDTVSTGNVSRLHTPNRQIPSRKWS